MPKKLVEGESLSRTVSFRLAPMDYDNYIHKVRNSGMDQSKFFRAAVLENRTQVIARPPASADKQRIVYLFSKTSNNVNQMARRLNTALRTGAVDAGLYAEILAELTACTEYMKSVIADVD